MPSAEKLTKLETKLEVIQPMEQKASECAQKESDQNNGEKNPLPPIQQGLQVITNKIRNLEKRKVRIYVRCLCLVLKIGALIVVKNFLDPS